MQLTAAKPLVCIVLPLLVQYQPYRCHFSPHDPINKNRTHNPIDPHTVPIIDAMSSLPWYSYTAILPLISIATLSYGPPIHIIPQSPLKISRSAAPRCTHHLAVFSSPPSYCASSEDGQYCRTCMRECGANGQKDGRNNLRLRVGKSF